MEKQLTNEQIIKRAKACRRLFTAESCIVNKYLKERIVGCDINQQRLDFEFDMCEEFANANGVVHGGLIAWIADLSMAAALAVYKGEYHGATIDMLVNYINPISIQGKILVKVYSKRLGNSVRRGECEIYSGDTLMASAVGNFTGKTMTGSRMIAVIDEETWRIEDDFVRGFVLNGKERTAVIDSGVSRKDFERAARMLTQNPNFVINTHSDKDHVFGNEKFETIYMNEKDWPHYMSQGFTKEPVNVKDGDIIDLGERPLKIIETPGHTKGSICILDVNSRALYAGDTVQDEAIFMFGDHRDLGQYVESIRKLISLKDEFDVIYCSHGSLCLKPDFLEGLLQGAEKLLDNTAGPGFETEVFGHKVIKHDFGCCSFLTL